MLNFKVYKRDVELQESYRKALQENEYLLRQAQEGEASYADGLGWLDTEEWANRQVLENLQKLAGKIRREADAFVLIGVGGSNNAARSVIEAIQKPGSPEIIYAGNTLSANALKKMLARLDGKSVYIDCIAKNFETLEPGASFRVLRGWLYERYGEKAAERIIATGTKGSLLEKICMEKGYTFLEFPENIGGRYTAMSNVGLLPMAVAGIDIESLVKGAHDMQVELRGEKAYDTHAKSHVEGAARAVQEESYMQGTCGTHAGENPAYQYACMRNVLYRQGYRVEMLSSFEPQFKYFYKWWIQLFAESEGKDGKGLFPVASEYSEELHSVGQFVQDGTPILFETFLDVQKRQDSLVLEADDTLAMDGGAADGNTGRLIEEGLADGFGYLDGKDFWNINKIAYEATVAAHSERVPCMTLEIGALDAYHFGQLFYFFQFACYLSCEMMGVNPFDQPGVEAYKKKMFESLGKEK